MMILRLVALMLVHALQLSNAIVLYESSVVHMYPEIGTNITLPCLTEPVANITAAKNRANVMWIREGKTLQHSRVLHLGDLLLVHLTAVDSGLYTCREDTEDEANVVTRVFLHVKTPPPAPVSVVVYSSTVLALVTWKLDTTEDYCVTHVSVIYQKLTEDLDNPAWHRTYPEHVGPGVTQIEVYHLEPNTTYRYRVWATSKLGPGDYTEYRATTEAIVDQNGPLSISMKHFAGQSWLIAVTIGITSIACAVSIITYFVIHKRRTCFRRRDCEDMELVTSLTSSTYYELGTSIDNSHNDGRALLRLACDGSITHPVRL